MVLALELPVVANETASTSQQLDFFESKVRPLLATHCYQCHSSKAKRVEGSLLLDSRSAHLRGGDSGEAVIPGDADGSLLIEAVRYEGYEMPPKGKLPDADIDVLVKWVDMGAPWPAESEPTGNHSVQAFDLEKRKSEHWLWQPVTNPAAPKTTDSSWPSVDLDHFVLEGLEKSNLRPAPDAAKQNVLRRLYLDLIGLPPTVEQVRRFTVDQSGNALENVVDELLQSPHFGERWGRHWLDLVRYAESRGHEFDNDSPNAFQYRDYIIRALNADVPYDQLVREHIAGDLVDNPRMHPTQGFNESVLGTGFWFLGEWVHSPVDIRKDESDRFDNMVDVMSKTFLGVTVSCARCHDHKFDAISTADYYSLTGFLHSSDYRQVRFESIEHNKQISQQLAAVDDRFRKEIAASLDKSGLRPPSQASFVDHPAVVADFGNLPQRDFMQDGFLFGDAPRHAGEAFIDASGNVRIATRGSAVSDPFWNGLRSITAGSVQNRSKLAKLPKSGRTLRSPTFELTDAVVSCRVSGNGHVIACVDSHRLVAGPLHGETIKPIKKGTSWTTLNLQRYLGHRMHLEFVPGENSQLTVRLIAQGLDQAGRNEIDRRLEQQDQQYVAFAKQANDLIGASESLEDDSNVEQIVFADFESGTYDDWTVTGDAFGDRPQLPSTIGKYQGDVAHKGKWFVNSHNIREGGAVRRGDSLTGTLTSPEFTIECDAIAFLVGGGNHKGKTCVNLLVDGSVVRTATGRAKNRMAEHRWDVRELRGKQARIQAVDNHTKGWGNIGLDHIVFEKYEQKSKKQASSSVSRHPAVATALSGIVREWQRERKQLRERVMFESHVAPAMLDGSGEDAHVYIRGNSSKHGKLEPRHFLTAISSDQPMAIARGSGRLELASAINDPRNPLTSRVIVNRIWHHLMGRGIVATTDDFGVLGLRPSNPELLDHLASKFDADGRSIKKLIRYVVLSRTYQMSDQVDVTAVDADPKNLLWHHRPPKRLEGEVIRDSLLALSGKLDTKQFGPPVPIHLTSFMDGRGRPKTSGPLDGDGRRSIYIAIRRNFLSPFMLTFDTPIPFSAMGRRNVSNVPAQALILMNDPFVAEQARGWAKQAMKVSDQSQERIEWLYMTAFARKPKAEEMTTAKEYLGKSNDAKRWTSFAHALINTKEFIFPR